jgi:hypothetical protein
VKQNIEPKRKTSESNEAISPIRAVFNCPSYTSQDGKPANHEEQKFKVSRDVLREELRKLTPLAQIRKTLTRRGQLTQVGDKLTPLPAIACIEELSRTPQGQEIRRAGEMTSTHEAKFMGDLPASPRPPKIYNHDKSVASYHRWMSPEQLREFEKKAAENSEWELNLVSQYAEDGVNHRDNPAWI